MALTAIPAAGAKLRGSIYSANLTERTMLFVAKSSDESVTSSTTLQNDDELALTVVASAEYHGELVAVFTSAANAAGDINIGFTVPTGSTLHFMGVGPHNSLASGSQVDGEFIARLSATSGSTVIPYGASTVTTTGVIKIRLTTGANAGTLQVQWAQQSSNANATTMKAGSYMWLMRTS